MKKREDIIIRSSAAEYLTYAVSAGGGTYIDTVNKQIEKFIWTQSFRGCNCPEIPDSSNRRFP